jgi:hypothetical protein
MSAAAQPSELEKRVFIQLTVALGRELKHRLVLGRAPRKNKHAAAELSPKALQLRACAQL